MSPLSRPDPLDGAGPRFEATAAETFVVNGAEVYSTVAQRQRDVDHAPDPWPGVGLDLTGRWAAGGARDNLRVVIPADTAGEIGDLRPVAEAARHDLADHLAGVPWEQIHQRGRDRYRTHITIPLPPELFARLHGADGDAQTAAAAELVAAAIALADNEPVDFGDDMTEESCALCETDAVRERGETHVKLIHEPTCPYARARAATKPPPPPA